MKPYVADPDFTLYVGDVRDVLRALPDESVHCCVTSPPYWGLRDYGTTGQLGLEPTPDKYVAAMVGVFHEVRRVLRRDGTCWLNLGDSYGGVKTAGRNDLDRIGTPHPDALSSAAPVTAAGSKYREGLSERHAIQSGFKAKDLIGIPWRVAFALQADGWYLRSDIIWSKPNPMPESVTDRPTKAHEYLFLLSRSPRYFFDQEAVREPYQGHLTERRLSIGMERQGPKHDERVKMGLESASGFGKGRGPDGRVKTRMIGADGSVQHRDGERWPNLSGRNVRSVWEIATQPYPEAHFATFPEELARRCIVAGCPERGVVLDPFMGSGTTALVARRCGRRAVGIELNPEYAALAAERLSQLSLLAEEVA